MKHQPTPHRRVAALLFAAAALPFTPGLAQDVAAPPPVVVTPPPVVVAPPPPVSTAPTPPPIVMPPVTRATPPAAEPEARPTTRAATRTPTRQVAPVRRAPAATAAPAPAPVAEPAPPPVAEPVAAAPAPIPVETPVATEGSVTPAQPVEEGGSAPWALIAAIVGVLAVGLVLFLLSRRRRSDAYEREEFLYDAPIAAGPVEPTVEPQPYVAPYVAPALAREDTREEPVAVPVDAEPAIAADATPAVETLDVGQPAEGDVAAMAAASEPHGNRPWLEMLMRPLRAGTTSDDARVEFELTIGNTGGVPARDVTISTWMFPAGSQASEMERLLIDSEDSIAPGDGTRVAAAIAMPKAALSDTVLPVVVADARYRLPDGSEGRTQAAFAFGLPDEGELAPFPTDRSSGLLETVEARLHGEPERN